MPFGLRRCDEAQAAGGGAVFDGAGERRRATVETEIHLGTPRKREQTEQESWEAQPCHHPVGIGENGGVCYRLNPKGRGNA
ncbi:hypothetical protein GCM10011497_13740 [Elstera cyanobacteriorum]|nr:hypothetical protein GCM10011497_13740 [Elstera cyanobacteriorum]